MGVRTESLSIPTVQVQKYQFVNSQIGFGLTNGKRGLNISFFLIDQRVLHCAVWREKDNGKSSF